MPAEVRSMFPQAMFRFWKEVYQSNNIIMLNKESQNLWTKKMEFLLNSHRQRLVVNWIRNASHNEIIMAIGLLDSLNPRVGQAFEDYVKRNRDLLI